MRGSDLFWHVATGKWMWQHRSMPLADPFSFTRLGQHWVHHEWGADPIYYAWASLFGMDSLVFWKWAVILGAYLLLMRLLHRLTSSPMASYAAVVFAVAVGAPFIDVRPQLYSLLGVVVVLRLTLVRPRPSWWLPLVFLVWVNVHGGYFFGLMEITILFSVIALEVRREHGPKDKDGRRRELRRLLFIWVACGLACLVNPNHIHAYVYPLQWALDRSSPFRQLGEWLPPFQPGGIQAPLFRYAIAVFVVASAVVLALRSQRRRRIVLAGLLLGALTLAMSLTSRRFISIFAICSSLVIAPALAQLVAPLQRWLSERARLQILPPLLATALGAFWLYPYPLSSQAFLYLTAEDFFPIETLNFIEVNQISGKVFNYYNWGGYIQLRTGGRLKIFIDGRADTVYDVSTYLKNLDVLNGDLKSVDIIESSGADFFTWPRDKGHQVTNELLRTGRWRLLYQDHMSVFLVRQGVQLPADLKPTPESPWRELTLGMGALSRGRPTPAALAEARGHLARAIQMKPNLAMACYMLARVLALEGAFDAARQQAKSCYRICPYPEQMGPFQHMLERLEASRM